MTEKEEHEEKAFEEVMKQAKTIYEAEDWDIIVVYKKQCLDCKELFETGEICPKCFADKIVDVFVETQILVPEELYNFYASRGEEELLPELIKGLLERGLELYEKKKKDSP